MKRLLTWLAGLLLLVLLALCCRVVREYRRCSRWMSPARSSYPDAVCWDWRPWRSTWPLLGRITPVALLGLLFVHNDTVTLGFVNYLFAVGLALCIAALWIRLRLETQHGFGCCCFHLLCSLVFFSHLHRLRHLHAYHRQLRGGSDTSSGIRQRRRIRHAGVSTATSA